VIAVLQLPVGVQEGEAPAELIELNRQLREREL
jgi:hypothetical protein